jgi:biopolymer transport protein ExbD
MRIRRSATSVDKIELQMTPMIDVVFQFNIYFLFTFKIVMLEGDFNIHMPSAAAARSIEMTEALPMTLVMKAGPEGQLAELRLAGRSFGNGPDAFPRLRQQIRAAVDAAGGPGKANDLEVEIDADYNLNYQYVIDAMTHITGYIDQNGEPRDLIKRVKFTPPKRGGMQGAGSTE